MNRKQPLTYDEFKTIYSKVPRLCVDLIIKDKKGILLTLRQKNGWEGQWHLPGGTVLYKETVLETAKRVANEELGQEIKINKFIGYLEYFSEESERGFGYTISLAFLCKLLGQNLILDNQVKKVDFFKILPKNMIKEQKKFLSTYTTS